MAQVPEMTSSAWWKLPWWALLVIAGFLALALFGERGVLRVMEVSLQGDRLRAEIARLSEQNGRLAEEVRGLRSDRSFIEDIARRDLGLVKAHEIIYVFPRDEPSGRGSDAPRQDADAMR